MGGWGETDSLSSLANQTLGGFMEVDSLNKMLGQSQLVRQTRKHQG